MLVHRDTLRAFDLLGDATLRAAQNAWRAPWPMSSKTVFKSPGYGCSRRALDTVLDVSCVNRGLVKEIFQVERLLRFKDQILFS